LKSRANKKINAASPPRQEKIEATSQMIDILILNFFLTCCSINVSNSN
jgi:hypothetical protein